MDFVHFAGVLRDCMLPVAARLPEDSWARAFLNCEEVMTLLPRLAATCSEWRDAVHGSPEFAALRLALADFAVSKRRAIARRSSRARESDMVFMFSLYERALPVLSSLWLSQKVLDERLQTRCAPMAELSGAELQTLRTTLTKGWD